MADRLCKNPQCCLRAWPGSEWCRFDMRDRGIESTLAVVVIVVEDGSKVPEALGAVQGHFDGELGEVRAAVGREAEQIYKLSIGSA